MDYQEYPGCLQYTWLSPAMGATGQSQQMLQGIPHQHPCHAPFPDQVYPAQYYHQSQHMMQPLPPYQICSRGLSWNTMSLFPHDLSHFCPECPPFQYASSPNFPSSAPNLYQYTGYFHSPTQQPSPFINSNYTGSLRSLHHPIGKNSFQSSIPC